MADDQLLLRQLVNLLRGPGALVLDQAGQLQFPGGAIDGFDVLDVVIGIESRRLDHLQWSKCRREVIGPEDRPLHGIIPRRHRAQPVLDGFFLAHVTAGQQRERAERERAAQHPTAIEILDQRPAFLEHGPIDGLSRAKERRRADSKAHGITAQCLAWVSPAGWAPDIASAAPTSLSSKTGPPVIMATRLRGTSSASIRCTATKATIADMQRK